MRVPSGLAFAGGSLWVAEIENNRVTRFDNVPSSATNLGLAPTTSTVQLSWTATDNPFGAPSWGSYAIQYSSDAAVAFSTTAAQISVSTAGVLPLAAQSYGVGGLLANTTYFFRVWSANVGLNYSPISDGATVATLTSAPTINAPPFLGIFATSVTAQWAALPASPSSATAEGYRLEASSTNFGAGTVYSSATAVMSQSTLTVSGLSQNTTYYFRVASLNWSGTPNYTALGQAASLAVAPSALAVGSVSPSSVSLNWSANGNPGWTPYEVSQSTDNFQTSFSTPIAFAANLTAAATTLSLAGGTTYYFRVRAQGVGGTVTAFAATASTVTLPGLLTSISTSALSTTAASWSWTNTAGPAVQSYSVYAASNAALLGATGATTFARSGLSTNTAYGVQIGAVDATGAGPLSPPVTAYTLAAVPAGSAMTAIYLSSITLSWNANGNPASTFYEVRRSTDNLAFALVSSQTATLFSDAQIGNATYYYKVRAVNGDGFPTAYDATISTFMAGQPPAPPSGLTLTNSSGAAVALSWNASPGPGLLQYDIYWDSGTGAVNYAAAYSTVAASTTSFTTGLLAPGTYYFAVRAKNSIFLEEQNTNVKASIAVVSAAPIANWMQTRLQFPASGKTVWGNRVTLGAGLFRGSLSGISQVRFDYRSAASTTAPWIAVPATESNNPVVRPPFYIHWDVTGLASGAYEVRAAAANGSGQADPDPPTALVTVGSASPDITETLVGGSIQHLETVSNAVDNTAFVGGPAGGQTLLVQLPTGALGASTSTVLQILNPAASPPAAPAALVPAGIFAQITLQNGQTALNVPALLTATYQDADGNGVVDGTSARADRLAFMVYQVAGGTWKAENLSTLDLAGKTVSVQTPHFSVFGVFAAAASALDSVRVYPNPYRPNGKNPDQGKPYSSADPMSGVIFDNLTQGARIQIFDVSGELVWQASSDITSGKIQWDARNGQGRDVATGGYIAVIRDLATGRSVVKKIAIIRH